MNIYYDIETVAKSAAELEELMPDDIKTPKMPYDLEHVYVPDFGNMPHGNIKDPVKLAEWREKKREDFHKECKAKVAKWLEGCLDNRLKFIDRAALEAGLCNVKLAGFREGGVSTIFVSEHVLWAREEEEQLLAVAKELEVWEYGSEAEMLREMWDWMSMKEARYIGFHSNRFDLPMLKRRSWANGVKVTLPTMKGAYVDAEIFRDLHEVWQSGDRGVMDGMGKVSKALGIEVSKTSSGGKFEELWARDKVAAIMYNHMDLLITEQIAERIL